MNKKFIITIVALIVLLFAGLGANYLLSLHKVTFDLQNDATSAALYDSEDKKVNTISDNSSLLLKDGIYYAIPEGESLSKDKVSFTVEGNDKTVIINPAYSKEYLNGLLGKELPDVQAAVTSKYSSLASRYTLKKGELYGRGEWFGGLLAPKVSDIRDQRDPYRVVLHKKDGKWEVVRRPEYVLTSSRYQEVPVEVLRAINSIAP